ncbi:MAG: hypothetical protein RLZZ297_1842 [Chloroflexota bacterium]|jgi:uncharacterized Zn finger protein
MAINCTITCPHCGAATEETMRVRVIERAINCAACGAQIDAPAAAHCVWCAYGDTPCPVVQNEGSCNPVQ